MIPVLESNLFIEIRLINLALKLTAESSQILSIIRALVAKKNYQHSTTLPINQTMKRKRFPPFEGAKGESFPN